MEERLCLTRFTDEPLFEPRAENIAPLLFEIWEPMLRVELQDWKRWWEEVASYTAQIELRK